MLATFGIASADDGGGGGSEKTAAEVETGDPSQEDRLLEQLEGGHEKTGTDHGGNAMSLRDIWEGMQARDEEMLKSASSRGAAGEPATDPAGGTGGTPDAGGTGDPDLDKIAAVAAEAELGVEKQAQELDAAGRIMARGYMDELMKLASSGLEDTHVKPNEIEPASADKNPAAGPRGTDFQTATNFAGTHGKHDKPIATAGSREVNKDVLKDGGNTTVGSGVTMSPPALGRFATVKDMMG
jgi:hypothetical protein